MAQPEKIELTEETYMDFLDCSRYGEADGVIEYLSHGIDVNWTDGFGITALHRGVCWPSCVVCFITISMLTQHVPTDTWISLVYCLLLGLSLHSTQRATLHFVSYSITHPKPKHMHTASMLHRLGCTAATTQCDKGFTGTF